MTEPEPTELSEPVDVVAWLRALPLDTVLLDSHTPPRAWQVRPWVEYSYGHLTAPREFTALVMAGSEQAYELADDEDAVIAAGEGPFRVLHRPQGGA